MNNSNFNDDHDLVAFLKQNQPIAPPPSPNLQAVIMEQVINIPIAKSSILPKIGIKKIGLVGAVIITALSLIVFNQTRSMQTAFNEAENLTIEKSLLSNWQIADEEFTSSYSVLSNSNYE